MALPILDGNQTSTTLATTVSGGAHYPNHIIASPVTIGSIPSISGTVTASVLGTNTSDGTPVALPLASGEDSFPQGSARLGVQLLKTDGTALDETGLLPIKGTVTASLINSITISSLPVQLSTTTIGGTSRLNVTLSSATTIGATAPSYGNLSGGSDGTNFRAILTDTSGRTVVTGSTSILGTPSVTFGAVTGSVSVLGTPSVTMSAIAGTVTANLVSTTVTVSALPSGALTTRFGSVTTANTSQLTSCVTNSSRKYLLAQNISAGTVTIGIGFSPTTTQGIQLTAGAGITFDSFCPTGAVYWLGATTGATFTILEG